MSCQFISHKKEVQKAMQEGIDRALEICGGKAEGYAKANLTRNHSVNTGALRNSITHKQEDEKTEVIGTNLKYAPYVELGHHQTPGRYVPAIKKRLKASWVEGKPYLAPAVDNHRAEYRQIIENELSK